jgi:hypothetical protein
MKLKQVADVIWQFAEQGRQKGTAKTYDRRDITQFVFMAFGAKMRERYAGIMSRQMTVTKRPDDAIDYYYYSGDLDIKEYVLGDANLRGMRRIEIPDDVMHLPYNMDITNVYPVGSCDDGDGTMEITQVAPAEENFYLGEDFEDFLFFVVKGKGLNTYHVPPCINALEVERVYVNENMDVSFDMAYDIANEVLATVLRTKGVPLKILDNPYAPKPTELKRRLEEQQQEI